MIDRKLVESLIADATAGTTCFLVSLNIGNSNEIKVEIDSDEGVTIDDCVKVSRGIEHNLDREEEDFSLRVTSPGADQPLLVWRQYPRHVGRTVKIETVDGRSLKGELIEVTDTGLTLKTEERKSGKGKKKVKIPSEEIKLEKSDIESTKVLLSFK